jgi:hypothetical protein
MAFQCPECSLPSLRITHALELPPDSRSDEISLQIIACSHCKFKGVAVYEESRRGSFDSDSFHHRGFYLAKEAFERVHKSFSRCPTPKNARCQCASHKKLGAKEKNGRWIGIGGFKPMQEFVIKQ